MIGPGLLALLLASALQPAAAMQPSEDVAAAATLWGECTGGRALEFAARPDPVETAVQAVEAACTDASRAVSAAIARDHGAARARATMPMLRERVRGQIRQTILEARGAPRQRGAGDETRVWGECIGARSTVLAAGDLSPDRIAYAALADCAEHERAVRAWAARILGAGSGSYMDTLRRQARESALRRIAEARAGR